MKTKKEKRKGGIGSAWCLALGAAVVLVALSGCENPAASTPKAAAYTTYLYMTDSTSGKVYAYDPAAQGGLASSLLTTAGSAGEIKFFKGVGYVAVGYGTGAGVYYFNPSSAVPAAVLVPGTGALTAQYFAFVSPTKAYFSTYGSGLYSFNPSNLAPANVTAVASTANLTLQDVIVGGDGNLYVADNGNARVLKIDPANGNLIATYNCSQLGTTGLALGTYGGSTGVFVANTGGYGTTPTGSIDFIPYGTASTTLTAIVSTASSASIYPGRLAVLANGNLIATGGAGHTYYVDVSGTATASEIKAGTSSFGSFSIAYDSTNNLVYVPYNVYSSTNATNLLYVFSGTSVATQTSYSPVTVMTKTDNLANVAFYQN